MKRILIILFLLIAVPAWGGLPWYQAESETKTYLNLPDADKTNIRTVNDNIRAAKYGDGITITGITANLSTITGSAFITNVSTDLRPYLGMKVIVSDGVKTCDGYLKQIGTSETLGDELYSTTDFTTGWTVKTGWSVSEGTATHDGSTGAHWIYQTKTRSIGELYKIGCNVSSYTSGKLFIIDNASTYPYDYSSEITSTGDKTFYHTASTTSNLAGFGSTTAVGTAPMGLFSGSITSPSFKVVTAPDNTGFVIYDSLLGSQNWTANGDINTNYGTYTLKIGKFVNISTLSTNMFDNGYTNETQRFSLTKPRQSTFSRFVFTTDSPTITVYGTNTIYSTYPSYAHIGVRVNGIDQTPLSFTANGSQSFTVDLSSFSGTKTVELIAGLQSKPVPLLGSYIDTVMCMSPYTMTVTTPSASNRIVFYGDSILAGGNATNPETSSVLPILRNTYNKSVMAEAWGYRNLQDEGNLDTFTTRINGYSPSTMWIQIGTNDFGLNKQSAADFGTDYASLLDKLHASMPSLVIYCQTPLYRSDETTPNTFSDTLSDYRDAITSAVSTRTSYAILVDGSIMLSADDLDDGLHPSTAGHLKYAQAINAILP